MKDYVGVKEVKAEPMNRENYNILRGWTLPDSEDGSDEGYHIIYPDGYERWSPREQFEKANREIGSGERRIPRIYSNLPEHILDAFNNAISFYPKIMDYSRYLNNKTSKLYDPNDERQMQLMIAYYEVLIDRIEHYYELLGIKG